MEIFQLEGLAEIQTILTRKTHFHDWKDFFLSFHFEAWKCR